MQVSRNLPNLEESHWYCFEEMIDLSSNIRYNIVIYLNPTDDTKAKTKFCT